MKSLFWSLVACLSIKCFVHQCAGAPNNVFTLDVPNVSKLGASVPSFWSPIYTVEDIPWKVLLRKEKINGDNWLNVYLYCAMENIPSNWSHPAVLFRKFLPSSSPSKPIQGVEQYTEPFTFDNSGKGSGGAPIKWSSLIFGGSKFVQKDTIKLHIEIKTPNPRDPRKSTTISKTLDRCCDDGGMVKYELKINNIDNLMAVQSPVFKLRGVPWSLQAYKQLSQHLGLRLESKYVQQFPYRIKMSILAKLLSTKASKDATVNVEEIKYNEILDLKNIISWADLLKPGNGFVVNNSITMTVTLVADIPDGVVVPSRTECVTVPGSAPANTSTPKCPICLGGFEHVDVSFTPCGHFFCRDCVQAALEHLSTCPMCKKPLQLIDLLDAHLPFITDN